MSFYMEPEHELSALTHILASYFRNARYDPKNIEKWIYLGESSATTGQKKRRTSKKLTQVVASEVLGITPRAYSDLENEHNLCKFIIFCRFLGKFCDDETRNRMCRDIYALYQKEPLENEI